MDEIKSKLMKAVVRKLKTIQDPEIPVSVYDLGLIYNIEIDDDQKVFLVMTHTTPTCPMADVLVEMINDAITSIPGVTGCSIEITFEPAWSKERMSDEALIDLGLI
ncbi:MAG: metal-sulfur cluster assembly factor [Bacteroidales bacterium]